LLPHFVASATYLHTVIYKSFSPILPVAWSLEVEVQFYLLAPLIFCLFLIKNKWVRWTIYLLVIVAGSLYWFNKFTLPHVFKFIHYFLMGILLADLNCLKIVLTRNQYLGLLIGIFSLLGFIFIPSVGYLPGYLIKHACMFFLFHTVLSNPRMKNLFSAGVITVIGGMCYSIYLLHFGVISFAGQLLLRSGIDVTSKYYFIPFAICFTAVVLFVSAIYFLLVEKPFMRRI
jgi:peptidoglycan/LPS O-acetylase OafA/YrhL